MIERLNKETSDLFDPDARPRPVLAVCFNRTLVPFIRQRIEIAYRQRTNEELPEKSLLVTHFNALLYYLHRRGFCGYYRVGEHPDAGERAARYLADLQAADGEGRERLAHGLFHAVYVDEGQDFHEQDYRVLMELCAKAPSGQPRLLVFYDDAQNLYGLKRPTWSDLGLEIRGRRSVVMDECFRNTRNVIEPAFNLLLGIHADDPQSVRTRSFADTQTLKEKDLIRFRNRHIQVRFGKREGDMPSLGGCETKRAEEMRLAERCDKLLREEGLLPQDILVLTFTRHRATELARAIAARVGNDRVCRPYEDREKDDIAIRPDKITVSTVASAKGYDAPYVLIGSLDEFSDDLEGRVSLYVACTRARDWLDVTAVGRTSLVREFERALAETDATAEARSTGLSP